MKPLLKKCLIYSLTALALAQLAACVVVPARPYYYDSPHPHYWHHHDYY
jgi:hypothetical protein